MKTSVFGILLGAVSFSITAQPVLFDFDSAPFRTALPISLTVEGVTAQFSATGQGYSIQRADTMGFTPAGFSGLCIYPDSIFQSDLMISFSVRSKSFSILYAPQELGCDDSARMRVTAYLDGAFAGTGTTNASQPGTWPAETLAITLAQGFNQVVVHYDQRPACTDYGPIFMADNMQVTPAPPPIVLSGAQRLADGSIQFGFTNTPGSSFTVFGTTDLTLPLAGWTSLGPPTEIFPGQYTFTEPPVVSAGRRFYFVRSP